MMEKQVCSGCGNAFKNLAAHQRFNPSCAVGNPVPAASGVAEAAQALGSLDPQVLQALAEQYLAPMMERVAQKTVQQALSDTVQEFGKVVDAAVEHRFTVLQREAPIMQTPIEAAPTQQRSQGGVQDILLNAVIQKLMAPETPASSTDAFLKQLDALGSVVAAIDRVRGAGSGGGWTPSSALAWQKWEYERGYEAGKLGVPKNPPEFPTAKEHIPPSPQMGK